MTKVANSIEHKVVTKTDELIYRDMSVSSSICKVDTEIDDTGMLAACIIQPSDSMYAASIVLIKKGDQTLRLCVFIRIFCVEWMKDF